MSKYIFITTEGYTFQPGSDGPEPDTDNMQVVGFGEGPSAEDALRDMLGKNTYLAGTTFDQILALELRDGTREVFSLQSFPGPQTA